MGSPRAVVFLHDQQESDQARSTPDAPALQIPAIRARACELAGYEAELIAPPSPGLIAPGIRASGKARHGDLIISCQGFGFVATALARGSGSRVPLVVDTWKIPGIGSSKLRSRLMDRLLDALIRRAVVTVVCCDAHLRCMHDRYPSQRAVFVSGAADVDWFKPGGLETTIVPRLGIKPGEFLLCVGDNDRDDGFVFATAKRLGRSVVRVTRHPLSAERARRAAAEVGGEIHIVVRVPWTELRDLYRGAWATVVAPAKSPHPNGLTALTEAMACGTALLFPDNGTPTSYITHGEDGWLFPELSEDSLLGACRTLEDDTLRLRLRHQARATCLARINHETAAHALATAIRESGFGPSLPR